LSRLRCASPRQGIEVERLVNSSSFSSLVLDRVGFVMDCGLWIGDFQFDCDDVAFRRMFDGIVIRLTSACWIARPSIFNSMFGVRCSMFDVSIPAPPLLRCIGFHQLHRVWTSATTSVVRIHIVCGLVRCGRSRDVFDERRQPPAFLDDEPKYSFCFCGSGILSPARFSAMSRTDAMGARNSCETLETKLDFISLSSRCCRNARQAASNPISAAAAETATSEPNQNVRAPCRW